MIVWKFAGKALNLQKNWKPTMKDILRLIRPKQWLKNVFVLVPMFFGGALTNGATVYASLVAFVAFHVVNRLALPRFEMLVSFFDAHSLMR